MNPRRVAVLFYREVVQGPRNFIFVWAIVAPVVISLIVSLVFGSLFSAEPELGIVDRGGSRLVEMAAELDSVAVMQYDSEESMLSAIESGNLDMGIVLPEGFDSALIQGMKVEIRAYTSGESLAENRVILGSTVAGLVRELAGQESPVAIEIATLGEEESLPWSDRLLPLVVLMAVYLGGLFLPATAVINEKERRTMQALLVTPATTADVLAAKGLAGVVLSLVMGVVILLINQVLGTEPLLLMLVLALGAVMAAEVGLLCGIYLKDVSSLFTIWKLGGILLFGPALVYIFPQIPEWVARVFPTYYLVQPIIELALQGAGWRNIAGDVMVLAAVDAFLGVALFLLLRKTTRLAG